MAKAQNKSTSTKDGLAKILEKQREDIMEYLDSASYALEEEPSTNKQIRFYVDKPQMDGEEKLPRLIADINNVYYVLSYGKLRKAYSASTRAIKAHEQRQSKEALQYCIRAERLIGEALALAHVWKVESVIAKGISLTRHKGTEEVRAKVIKLWRDEFDPKVSAEKVAEELVGRIHWKNGKAVTHRTIAEWISKEKKRASSPK